MAQGHAVINYACTRVYVYNYSYIAMYSYVGVATVHHSDYS